MSVFIVIINVSISLFLNFKYKVGISQIWSKPPMYMFTEIYVTYTGHSGQSYDLNQITHIINIKQDTGYCN